MAIDLEEIRGRDWSSAGLGPYDSWPCTLRGYVSMILAMPVPAIIFWGPDQTQIYNDGYAVIMGPRHPRYFGAPYRECWPDTYPIIYPWMRRVLDQGEVVEVTRTLIILTRHGFSEETYFTFTFSPLRDDQGAIAGIIQPVFDVTSEVLGERRADTLRLLGARDHGASAISPPVINGLASNPQDIPFALVYLAKEDTGDLVLAAHTGFGEGAAPASAPAIARRVLASGEAELTDEVDALLGRPHTGHWPEPTRSALVVPLRRSAEPALGVAVLGISPRLPFDARYRAFFESVARELAVAVSHARARAAERELLAREQEARREAELQKEHLVALLSQAPTAMVLLRGREFVVELANPLACELWRRTPEQVHGLPLFEVLPELRDQVFERLLRQVYDTGEAYVGRETHAVLRPAGRPSSEVILNFVYSPIRTAAGEVDGVLVIAFDVTEQVRAREQLDELRSAAESASRAKDQFLAILGHELRNPLAPILTAVQLMAGRGDQQVERERRIIERQARHLVRLVDDMLDLSRVLTGKVALKQERIELAEVVATAVEMTRPLIEERAQLLTVNVPERGLLVQADPERLAQVFANLLSNAAKYTERGGMIAIDASGGAGWIEATVRDSGIGISAEMLPRVFEMFAQERQALDRSSGGLGLGLTIVRSLVQLHGGSIEARSAGPGEGSEFAVRLPLARAAEERAPRGPAQASQPPPGLGAASRHVLIVDDNQDAAELLAAGLELAGFQIRLAHDGPGALAAIGEFRPDIALLDIGLPGMDGYELATQLRQQAELRHLRLVALTGYGQDSDRQRSREAGFDAHLVKPIDLLRLRALLLELAVHGDRPAAPPEPASGAS